MLENIYEFYSKLLFDGFEPKVVEEIPQKLVPTINKLPSFLKNPRDYVCVMGDTHDNDGVLKTVQELLELEVIQFIHTGDIVHDEFLSKFKDIIDTYRHPEIVGIYGVLGNHDKPYTPSMLNHMYEESKPFERNFTFKYDVNRFELNKKKFILYHGDDLDKLSSLADEACESWNFLIYGHWHTPTFLQRIYKTFKSDFNVIVNPGAAYPPLLGPQKPTILLLNTEDITKSFFLDISKKEEEELHPFDESPLLDDVYEEVEDKPLDEIATALNNRYYELSGTTQPAAANVSMPIKEILIEREINGSLKLTFTMDENIKYAMVIPDKHSLRNVLGGAKYADNLKITIRTYPLYSELTSLVYHFFNRQFTFRDTEVEFDDYVDYYVKLADSPIISDYKPTAKGKREKAKQWKMYTEIEKAKKKKLPQNIIDSIIDKVKSGELKDKDAFLLLRKTAKEFEKGLKTAEEFFKGTDEFFIGETDTSNSSLVQPDRNPEIK